MFQTKRQFKKEKSKQKARFIVWFLIAFFILSLFTVFLYFNFSFGRNVYISPVAKNKSSKTIFLENELEKAGITFTSVVQESDGSFEVRLKDESKVIISSKKDIKQQLSSLQLMLSRLTIEGKKLKILDFRFNYPVVTF
jgi:hypothetical protein